MPIYTLTPIDPDHPDWGSSTTNKPCIVKAKNETEAREAAKKKFGKGETKSPWEQSRRTTVEEVAQPEDSTLKRLGDLMPLPWPLEPINPPVK